MNARMISDQVIQRSRDMMAMQDHLPRNEIRAALLDVTVAVAKQVADNYCVVANQQNRVSTARGGKVLRDMRTLWRAVIRNVKKVYDSHPIMERHLYAVVAAYYPDHPRTYPKLLDHQMVPRHVQTLLACYGAAHAATTIKRVLEECYEYARA